MLLLIDSNKKEGVKVMYWLLLAIPLLLVIFFTLTRLVFHFNTCRRVSEKNPGEDLKGCPSWTLVDEESEKNEEVEEDK